MIIAVTAAISDCAYSQGVWGVETGVNFANLKGENISEDSKSRTGLLLAVYYQHAFEYAPIVLQPELMYSQKGLEFGNDTVVKLDYLVAAGLAAYYVDLPGQLAPFVKVGPYIGFNIKATEEFNGNTEDLEGIQKIDAGVIIRAGIRIDRFETGLRFAGGLTDVMDDDDAKNSVFGIFIGVSL